MFKWFKKYGRAGLVSKACALLLLLMMQYPLSVNAQEANMQEAGSANLLSGASGMTLDAGMPTNASSIADACANELDKVACISKLTANQMKTRQSTQEANPPYKYFQNTAKTPRPPETNEFQDFTAASVGKKLPLYGYNLFDGAPDTFAPVDNIPVTPDYLIGPGDEIVINVWGNVNFDIHAMVDRNGKIDLPKIGSVNVIGIRYQELQSQLKNAIGRVFRNFELSVSLGKLRSIQVFVVGQAKRPGVYTVSSLSTLVNTLFASGGPSSNGSMRHIQVKRNGQAVTEFDLYDLLLKGDKTKDIAILPGDVVYIPPVGELVAIYGSINTPAIYELKDDKTTLSDLLELAGGLNTTAAEQKVLLERIQDHKVRKVEEFQLDKTGLTHLVKDGDLVRVFAINARFDNAVTLRGNVAKPGRYPWKEGMRVKDLIPDMESLIIPEYWVKQNEFRFKPKQEPQPSNSGGNAANPANSANVENSANAANPANAPNQASAANPAGAANTLRADVKFNVAEINWDYAVIKRLNKDELTTLLIPFNLGKAISGKDAEQNLLLQPGDTITIFSKDDIQVPKAERTVYVMLEGEINNAGIYQALPGETLRQIVSRVGGLTPNAYLFGAEFDRETVREMQQQKLKEMTDKMEEAVNRNLSNTAQSALSREDIDNAKAKAEAQAALVARLRKVQATGRIVLEIPPESAQLKDLPDLALEDGDHFSVPARPSVVSVMGMVYNQNAFMYRSDKNIHDYLNQAGGPTRDADDSRMYVLRADGSVVSAQNSGWIFSSFSSGTLMPGDALIVPEMLDKLVFTKELKDWSQIIYQFALGAAGLKVLGI
jgi:polysaccharide export outer membrane protein